MDEIIWTPLGNVARLSACCGAIRVSRLGERASAGVSEFNNGPEANGVLLVWLTVQEEVHMTL